MKYIFKISVIALMIICGGLVFAQVNTATLITATVQDALTVTKNNDIAFGNLSATSTPILDANDQSHTDISATYTIADYTIGGTNTATVNVTFDATATLNDGSSGNMTFTPEVVGDASSGNQNTALGITTGGNITLGAGGYTIWVGGNLGSLSGQTAGTYTAAAGTGNWNISLVYN